MASTSRSQIEAYDHFLKKIKQFQTDVRFMSGVSEESILLSDLIRLFEFKHLASQVNDEAFLKAMNSNIEYIRDEIDKIHRRISSDHINNGRADFH